MSRLDLEKLLGTAVDFAQKLLAKNGEFYPFGASMDQDGKIAIAGAYSGEEHPQSTDVITLLEGGFHKAAKDGKIRAAAICLDIRVIPPNKAEKTDAIQVKYEHQDGEKIEIFVPYHHPAEVEFDNVFSGTGTTSIFGAE